MRFPLREHQYYKTSGYRTWNRPDHQGIDYAAAEGTPVYAVEDGQIYIAQTQPEGAGTNLWIHTADNYYWKYFHLSKIYTEMGASVRAGDLICLVGHTGNVIPAGPGGAHLHIELHEAVPSNPIDPTELLDACETAGNFPTDKEIDMTDDEWEQRAQALRSTIQNDTLGGLVAMAKVNYHYLDQAVRRLGGEPLEPFDVNSVER